MRQKPRGPISLSSFLLFFETLQEKGINRDRKSKKNWSAYRVYKYLR